MSRALLIAFLVVGCAGTEPAPAPGDGCEPEPAGADAGVTPSADAGVVPSLPSGGYLRLERFTSGAETSLMALAELTSGHSGPGRRPTTFYDHFPVDTCFQVPLMPAEPSFYDFVDIGPSIVVDGPARIELPRESLLGSIFYKAIGLDDIADGEYAVSLGGTLRMPAPPVLLEPAGLASGEVVLTGAPALRWQPTGADFLFFILQDGDVGRVCRLADDGAFDLPADASRGAPSWGTAVFMAVDRRLVELDGRAVELVGIQGQVAAYERP